MIASANAKYIRVPPRKAREVIDLIRGEDVSRALAIMDSCPRRAALEVKKVVQSALANAKANATANEKLNVERLYVARATVDEGPSLKRFMARAMGRATLIKKRMCHIRIELDERIKEDDSATIKGRKTKRSGKERKGKGKP